MVAAVPRRHKDAPPEEQLYAPIEWRSEGDYEDILYERGDAIAKISINRPEVHNAFRPPTLAELRDAFTRARDDTEVAAIIFTGAGDEAFCSGGDQRIRGDDGYIGDDEVAEQGVGRLDVGDLHVQIRRLPKPVVAMVAGYAVRRRPHPSSGLRPDDRRRQRRLRPDRTAGRELRRWLRRLPPGAQRRGQEGEGDLVPLPALRRPGGARYGPGQRRLPGSRPRTGDGRVVPRDGRPLPPRRCGYSSRASTPPRTAWRAFSSSPTTRRCSST